MCFKTRKTPHSYWYLSSSFWCIFYHYEKVEILWNLGLDWYLMEISLWKIFILLSCMFSLLFLRIIGFCDVLKCEFNSFYDMNFKPLLNITSFLVWNRVLPSCWISRSGLSCILKQNCLFLDPYFLTCACVWVILILSVRLKLPCLYVFFYVWFEIFTTKTKMWLKLQTLHLVVLPCANLKSAPLICE